MNEPLAICNYLVIFVTCLFSYAAFRNRLLEEKYIFEPEAILAWKQYPRLVTSGFLHAGWGHLFWNMLSLYFFGPSIELRLGPVNFLLIYFGAIIGGNLLSLYVHRHHEYRAYGASGGVCGIIFAYILAFPGSSISQMFMPLPIPGWLYAILFMLGSFFGMKANNRGDIGHDAHLGGAIIGLLITAVLHPEFARLNPKVFLIVLGASVVLLLYLWFNPLFLPLTTFFGGRSLRKPRSKPASPQARKPLEVDAILDKIAKNGMESLTAEERTVLHEVSGKYQRRGQSEKPKSGLSI